MKKYLQWFFITVAIGVGGLAVGGLITKPFTFSPSTLIQSSQVNTDFDVVYSEVNGNLSDANVSASANIQQSKISGLVASIQSLVLKVGDTMTGALNFKFDTPYLRLIGQEASAKDWRVAENAGKIQVDENTGTEIAPTWTTRYTLPSGAGGPATGSDLATKTYVDAQIAPIPTFLVAKKAADQTVNNSTTLVDDTHLFLALTASKSYDCEATLLLFAANTTADFKLAFTLPAGASMFWGPPGQRNGADLVTVSQWLPTVIGGTPDVMLSEASTLTIGSNVGTTGLWLKMIVRISTTAGNLKIQWAQNTANVSDSKVLKDSTMICRLIQ